MSEPDDRELDQYLAGQHPLSARYREAKASDTPPPELDAAILASARAATPRPRRSVRRWALPMGLAASLMLGGPLVWQMWQTEEAREVDFAHRSEAPVAAEQAERELAQSQRAGTAAKAEKQAMARAPAQTAVPAPRAPDRSMAAAPSMPAPTVESFSAPAIVEERSAAIADAEMEDRPQLPYIGFGPALFGDDEESVRIAWGRPLTVEGREPDHCRQLFAEPQTAYPIAFMLVEDRFVRYDVTGPQFESPGGIRVGDARETVEARFESDEIAVSPHKYVDGAEVLTVTISPESTVRLVFEMTTEGQVARWRLGVPPAVHFVEGCS